MSNYARGACFERLLQKKLNTEGYTVNSRSAGSHGLIDVWAYHPARRALLMIQAKKTRLTPGALSRIVQELKAAGLVSHGRRIMVQVAYLAPGKSRRLKIEFYTVK